MLLTQYGCNHYYVSFVYLSPYSPKKPLLQNREKTGLLVFLGSYNNIIYYVVYVNVSRFNIYGILPVVGCVGSNKVQKNDGNQIYNTVPGIELRGIEMDMAGGHRETQRIHDCRRNQASMYESNVGAVNVNAIGGAAPGAGAGTRPSAETCASLFPRTRKLKVDIEVMLDRFEKSSGGPDEVMMRKLTSDLSQFFANIERMQDVLSQEYNQRDM